MEIGKTLRVTTRKAWRAWLEKNHARKKEIWLVYATKKSGKGRVPGMEKIRGRMSEEFVLPPDIVAALKRDPQTWKNFQRFPKWYQRVRVGWLDMSRGNRDVFQARLRYFLKMTAQNKRFGMVQ